HTRDESLASHVRTLGFAVFAGSEDDVLDRYYRAAKDLKADVVVRITGDCPLVDPRLVDELIDEFNAEPVDYLSNKSYPDGLDIEVFTFTTLEGAWQEARQPGEREHVTPYITQSGRFRTASFSNLEDLSGERWTVDEPEDLEVVKHVFEHFAPRLNFGWK